MMLTYRLVHLIETHSDALAHGLLSKVQESPHTRDYCRNVPSDELKQRVYEIYRHLGEWLVGSSAGDVAERYMQIGARRARQEVPLSQLIWAIILTKENLWEYILNESSPDRVVEIFGKQELLQLLDKFFDQAIYFAAVGHERAMEETVKKQTPIHPAA
ncbi:MAG TPA: protoglobin domain-containing protein [Terriglobales bacterium]|nr:protoglobin domain-containing protein [Terriglobales bacterium]